jgi:Bacteriophage Lambda NinG protein
MMFPKRKWLKGRRTSKVSYVQKLDDAFSKFIRLRDMKKMGAPPWVRCVTCGKPYNWKQLDCGHYITRDHYSTRWNEQNCNSQCTSCNSYKSGKVPDHGAAIDRMYGAGTAERLRILGAMKCKQPGQWFQERLHHYRTEVKRLKKELGV